MCNTMYSNLIINTFQKKKKRQKDKGRRAGAKGTQLSVHTAGSTVTQNTPKGSPNC